MGSCTGLTKVLVKEVAPINIRALAVVLGTFDTDMCNAAVIGKDPLLEDYKGSVAEQIIQFTSNGKIVPNGDKNTAMKVVYKVVVGEGAGTGRETERFLPLGTDMTVRVKIVQECLDTAWSSLGMSPRMLASRPFLYSDDTYAADQKKKT